MKHLLFSIFFLSTFLVYAQKQKPKNYSRFDETKAHFGFMLGFNSADFSVFPKVGAYEKYGLLRVSNRSQPGGQLGIVSTFNLGHPTLRLRIIPSLSFQERIINYAFVDEENPDQELTLEERIGSTNLDFPLMFQFRTTRHNNFATYVLLGAQYSLDLQSQEEKSQNIIDPFIKIKRDDFLAQTGVGVEFFAPYFKFGMEIKFSQSFVNSLVQDNTRVSAPLDKLFNRVWSFSLIFEG